MTNAAGYHSVLAMQLYRTDLASFWISWPPSTGSRLCRRPLAARRGQKWLRCWTWRTASRSRTSEVGCPPSCRRRAALRGSPVKGKKWKSNQPSQQNINMGPTEWSHENGHFLRGSTQLQIEDHQGRGHRFKTRCQQGLITSESPLKFTIPCVICIGWLHICFTRERCDMIAVNKRSCP